MVTRGYMLEKPSGPSAATRFLNWHAVPTVINGFGALEGALERVAVNVRRSPTRALVAALTLGIVLACVPLRNRRR